MFYILLKNKAIRDEFISFMKAHNISCVFHYIPLHVSRFGSKYIEKVSNSLLTTEVMAGRIVRLPLWIDMTQSQIKLVINKVYSFFDSENYKKHCDPDI